MGGGSARINRRESRRGMSFVVRHRVAPFCERPRGTGYEQPPEKPGVIAELHKES